jgi:hypothetical protein
LVGAACGLGRIGVELAVCDAEDLDSAAGKSGVALLVEGALERQRVVRAVDLNDQLRVWVPEVDAYRAMVGAQVERVL